MFKFLKEKLKGAIFKFSKKAEEEAKEPLPESEPSIRKKEVEEEIADEAEGLILQDEGNIAKPELDTTEEPIMKEPEKAVPEKILHEELEKELEEKKELKEHDFEEKEEKHEPKGFFAKLKEKVTTTTLSEEKFEELFSELELALMENNVAVEVIEKIKNDLKKNLVENPIKRMRIEETVKNSLRSSIESLFDAEKINLLDKIKNNAGKPFIIAFFGINGSGKTTTIAKIGEMLKRNKVSCVLAAADTFRAASIEQLQIHAENLGIKMIKHDYGSDPAAVAFDAIKHAKAKNIDAVLIDTAGRLHSNKNLMDELKKVVKIANPDLKIFVGESIAGNDCIEQIQQYNGIVGIDAIILTKADVDEKGGTAISVSYVTSKPIIYLGVGQEYTDLKEFEPKLITESLGF